MEKVGVPVDSTHAVSSALVSAPVYATTGSVKLLRITTKALFAL